MQKQILNIILLLQIVFFNSLAQNAPVIEVPKNMKFADIRLNLDATARTKIQSEINQIVKNNYYFQVKVKRANLYFPIIEKVFEQEKFPKDYMFLCLQESSLIPDAVSKSNAVGYWQFKKETAIECGLRVDAKIDERKNIIASSRGASKYIKKNNNYFDNWIYATISYYEGLGGTKKFFPENMRGVKEMEVTDQLHWYMLRLLAFKLVYENAVGQFARPDSVLTEYIDGAHKTLAEIAEEQNVDPKAIVYYNKWLQMERVPDDRIYSVILPVSFTQLNASNTTKNKDKGLFNDLFKGKKERFKDASQIPIRKSNVPYIVYINGVKSILAGDGDNALKLAIKGGISKDDFVEYNEMHSFDDTESGKFYYLEHKRRRAKTMFHTVQYDESLWSIAQNYGITVESIRNKNLMDNNEAVAPGRLLWLRSKRPKSKPVEYAKVKEPTPLVQEIRTTTTTTIDSNIIRQTNAENKSVLPKTNNTTETKSTIVKTNSLPENKENYTYHLVQTGETLFGIAKKYSISTDSIVEWNNLEGYKIKIEQNLIVGKGKSNPVPVVVKYKYHEVKEGETAYKISKMYAISIDDIKNWNQMQELNLKPGDKLIVGKE